MVGEANRYLSDQAPWKIKDDPERLATILHVALQVVSDCNTLLTPFLPHSAQKIHELLGGAGVHAPMPAIEEVSTTWTAAPATRSSPATTPVGARGSRYRSWSAGRWPPPKPVFTQARSVHCGRGAGPAHRGDCQLMS